MEKSISAILSKDDMEKIINYLFRQPYIDVRLLIPIVEKVRLISLNEELNTFEFEK